MTTSSQRSELLEAFSGVDLDFAMEKGVGPYVTVQVVIRILFFKTPTPTWL